MKFTSHVEFEFEISFFCASSPVLHAFTLLSSLLTHITLFFFSCSLLSFQFVPFSYKVLTIALLVSSSDVFPSWIFLFLGGVLLWINNIWLWPFYIARQKGSESAKVKCFKCKKVIKEGGIKEAGYKGAQNIFPEFSRVFLFFCLVALINRGCFAYAAASRLIRMWTLMGITTKRIHLQWWRTQTKASIKIHWTQIQHVMHANGLPRTTCYMPI